MKRSWEMRSAFSAAKPPRDAEVCRWLACRHFSFGIVELFILEALLSLYLP